MCRWHLLRVPWGIRGSGGVSLPHAPGLLLQRSPRVVTRVSATGPGAVSAPCPLPRPSRGTHRGYRCQGGIKSMRVGVHPCVRPNAGVCKRGGVCTRLCVSACGHPCVYASARVSMCACICVCVRAHPCISTCVHRSVCVHVRSHACASLHVYVRVRVPFSGVCVVTSLHVHPRAHLCASMCASLRTCTCVYTRVHTHVHPRLCARICVRACPCARPCACVFCWRFTGQVYRCSGFFTAL